eukprot:TRINITY_DN11767_c0_g1_i1.p1 TRINITY_DN11767_c0_g1~~TRINITY_DN11767_c0_g1_i1.p1  ORF type:complete len:131 (+),score=26.11 TRINITY_DN11767_c0_g1_i1:89-481(+)
MKHGAKVDVIAVLCASKYWFISENASDQLTTYRFAKKIAQHTFCKHCGVQSFYTPRSNPDGKAITIYCMDDYQVVDAGAGKLRMTKEGVLQPTFDHFNGQDWDAQIKTSSINEKTNVGRKRKADHDELKP